MIRIQTVEIDLGGKILVSEYVNRYLLSFISEHCDLSLMLTSLSVQNVDSYSILLDHQ